MAKKKDLGDMLPMKVIVGLSLQLGFAVATTAILFVYGGHWLDEKYETKYFFWIGLILGLVASFYLVWKIVKPLQARANMGNLQD
ncbi:MAG: AtpZ/AtpI family protein [Candidatus Gracilibacteria bacterium]|nr:AtpZ/AtpI family protein [Candidatus Gracilibacteria bacterium]MDD5179217.1 AtpZ/AtpI family protein [Candidatus Gracilibacteria bacterium]